MLSFKFSFKSNTFLLLSLFAESSWSLTSFLRRRFFSFCFFFPSVIDFLLSDTLCLNFIISTLSFTLFFLSDDFSIKFSSLIFALIFSSLRVAILILSFNFKIASFLSERSLANSILFFSFELCNLSSVFFLGMCASFIYRIMFIIYFNFFNLYISWHCYLYLISSSNRWEH